jgi:hypothetical protein
VDGVGRCRRVYKLNRSLELEALFPELNPSNYKITSPKDGNYNCIAWAAGDDTHWWEPIDFVPGMPMGGFYWPTGLPREHTLGSYILAFKRQGYRECESADYETGVEKVALYAKNGAPTHAARQLPNGTWTSKLGELQDIEHANLQCIEGDGYGAVDAILCRTLRSNRPSSFERNLRLP